MMVGHKGVLAVLALLLGLSACGQQPDLADGSSPVDMRMFADGDAVMGCGLSCSGNYGWHRQALKADYQTQDWNDLVTQLLTIGADNDQSWFYLASAAAGLGDEQAAQSYYLRSLTTKFPCEGILNVCDGLDLPALTFARLDALDKKLLASPAFTAGGSEVRLIPYHHVLKVPGVVDGQIPLLFAVDSGSGTVNLPGDVAVLMLKTGLLQKGDILGEGSVVLGNGATVKVLIFKIKSLRVGGVTLSDVVASTSGGPGEILLGQSFLSRCKSWSIDNGSQSLVLQQ